MLKHTRHKIDKKIIDNLTKYYTYYQKHKKLLGRFKFSIKKDDNLNYFILVDIIFL